MARTTRTRTTIANFTEIHLSVQGNEPGTFFRAGTPGSIWRPATRIAEEENLEDVLPGFATRMAKIYARRVKEAIEDQDIAQRMNWAELSPKYEAFKARAGLSTKMWKRSGQLVDAIQAFKFAPAGVWSVGIPPQARFREVVTRKDDAGKVVGHRLGRRTDVKILTIAKYLEFGTRVNGEQHVPPRPLFRPIQETLSKDIRRFWEDYKRDVGVEAQPV